MTKTWCVGGRHYSESINQNLYEKRIPKTNKIVKIVKEKRSSGGCNESQFFTK